MSKEYTLDELWKKSEGEPFSAMQEGELFRFCRMDPKSEFSFISIPTIDRGLCDHDGHHVEWWKDSKLVTLPESKPKTTRFYRCWFKDKFNPDLKNRYLLMNLWFKNEEEAKLYDNNFLRLDKDNHVDMPDE